MIIIISVNRLLGWTNFPMSWSRADQKGGSWCFLPSHADWDKSFLQVCFNPNHEINIKPSNATSARNFEGVAAHIRCQWRRKAEIAQLSSPRVGMPSIEDTHKSIAAAASSAEPPLRSGISANALTLSAARACAVGIPSATFFPSISIVAPASFAAVNLRSFSIRSVRHHIGEKRESTSCERGRTRPCWREHQRDPTLSRSSL